MKNAFKSDSEQFGNRLRQLMREAGYKPSPTILANEFNLLYWGEGITSHAARNWLNGVSLPKPDKLRVLADWLQVSPQYLMFGVEHVGFQPHVSEDKPKDAGSVADDTMIHKYQALAHDHRRMVREVVAGLYLLRVHQRELIANGNVNVNPNAASSPRAPRKPRGRRFKPPEPPMVADDSS
jgi:transcriptional regulator with XRE-family HTH domain